jgi:hypothetical protein
MGTATIFATQLAKTARYETTRDASGINTAFRQKGMADIDLLIRRTNGSDEKIEY